jgi:hypothetical protein
MGVGSPETRFRSRERFTAGESREGLSDSLRSRRGRLIPNRGELTKLCKIRHAAMRHLVLLDPTSRPGTSDGLVTECSAVSRSIPSLAGSCDGLPWPHRAILRVSLAALVLGRDLASACSRRRAGIPRSTGASRSPAAPDAGAFGRQDTVPRTY